MNTPTMVAPWTLREQIRTMTARLANSASSHGCRIGALAQRELTPPRLALRISILGLVSSALSNTNAL